MILKSKILISCCGVLFIKNFTLKERMFRKKKTDKKTKEIQENSSKSKKDDSKKHTSSYLNHQLNTYSNTHKKSNSNLNFISDLFFQSASVLGDVNENQLNITTQNKLSYNQFQELVESVESYRTQIQALSIASEIFVKNLQGFQDITKTSIKTNESVDLEYLINTTQLIGNVHQQWVFLLIKGFLFRTSSRTQFKIRIKYSYRNSNTKET